MRKVLDLPEITSGTERKLMTESSQSQISDSVLWKTGFNHPERAAYKVESSPTHKVCKCILGPFIKRGSCVEQKSSLRVELKSLLSSFKWRYQDSKFISEFSEPWKFPHCFSGPTSPFLCKQPGVRTFHIPQMSFPRLSWGVYDSHLRDEVLRTVPLGMSRKLGSQLTLKLVSIPSFSQKPTFLTQSFFFS